MELIPLEKMSKKQRREYYKKQRGNWGNINPSTKPHKNDYKEKKQKMKGLD